MQILQTGRYLALSKQQLGAFRKIKGDPGRRAFCQDFIRASEPTCHLHLGECWALFDFLLTSNYIPSMPQGECLTRGRSMHKGSSCWIELLDQEKLAQALAVLQQLDVDALHEAYKRVDERAFRARYTHFREYEAWFPTRQPSGMTSELFGAFAKIYEEALPFLDATLKSGLAVVCLF